MTELRDQFAMAALTGLLADDDSDNFPDCKRYAEFAYKYADAMMDARDPRWSGELDVRQRMVDDLDLSVRAANFLESIGIRTIHALKSFNARGLRDKGCTAKTAKEIFAELERSGL